MSGRIYVKQGDLEPIVEATLGDRNGPEDLTGATVKFIMKHPATGVVKVNAAATIVSALTGQVSYAWVTGNTDTPGVYSAEFQVTLPGGHPMSFPNDDHITVVVTAELGS